MSISYKVQLLSLVTEWVYCFSILCSCVKYVSEPEDTILLKTAMTIYRKFNGYPAALRLAMMLNQTDLVREIFLECQDAYVTNINRTHS